VYYKILTLNSGPATKRLKILKK